MSKKSKKDHNKKVAARNQRNKSMRFSNNIGIIEKQTEKTGLATPIEAMRLAKNYASKGINPQKMFQRKTG